MEPGKRRGHQFSLYLLPSSLLLVYFTPVLFYTYPWTKDIGMNQTAIPLVWKRTSKQTVAIQGKWHDKGKLSLLWELSLL